MSAALYLEATRRRRLLATRCAATLPEWATYARGDPQRPLVVIVSWLGARREHVDRYAEKYAARGYGTLSLVPPLHVSLLPSAGDEATAALLQALPEHPHGTLLHVASHGGYLFASQLFRAAAAGEPNAASLVRSARGLLLDSSPLVRVDGDTAARALASILFRTKAKPAGAVDTLLHLPLRLFFDAYFQTPSVHRRLAQLSAAWEAPPAADTLRRVPVACLYSAGDVLVPPDGIETWAAARRAAGWRRVSTSRFPASCPHVELLRYEPQRYEAELDAWLAQTAAAGDDERAGGG